MTRKSLYKIAELAPIGQSNVILYRNQSLVMIEKTECDSDFLMVSNEEWMEAARNLKPTTTLFYLYFAANKDGYQMALSPTAISKDLGISKSAYHNAFNELIEKGYMVKCGTKEKLGYETYCFNTSPQINEEEESSV